MPTRTNSPPHSAEDCSLEPIAIVGMACRLPGAVDSPAALWDVLVNKISLRTAKVPASRFNIDAHLHENLERPGSFTAAGGYFLDGAPEDFDPTFFGITPIEAMWMDPQQRKILEVAYECLESAGLSLDVVSGSNTAVFIGSFTSDYQQMSIAEKDFRHPYAATGVDPGIISTRIGNIFNLVGPSFVINTACSSSIYAIHNACNALRARDCEAAIAGGVNLIMTVDQQMNTAKLGVLSPTSTCHTFDASADGYGRAEGAGALFLKRLSDAIRDGDPVRGVIRSSAVNTNGKIAGAGITYPSMEGQSRVIRQAYEKANLDPQHTIYAECHGTGTRVGDPIEVHAVSSAMNDSRIKGDPLLVGAVKANIGHSEAASGIFAVMKAALMTEAGVIPGVAGFKNLNPEIKEKEWNVKINAETRSWPHNGMARRAGVSSFGYGGTNGHVILEEVKPLYPWYRHGQTKVSADYDHSSLKPFLVTLSAHDKKTLSKNITAHAEVADRYFMADLAFTLNMKRTVFAHRGFSIIREGHEKTQFVLPAFRLGVAPKSVPDLTFVFTGQGAQWAGMGAEAMNTFPVFRKTIKALDRALRNLPEPPSWTLESAISIAGKGSNININDPEIAQPVTTAIQIAIVDLFSSWQIHPTVSVGHSSGEIAAAYSAGHISAPEAIIAAFLRGYAVKRYSPSGTMLAVGLGAEEVLKYITDLPEVVIACENSPSSVTLSGSTAGIEEARERLTAKDIFARELKTGKAYHSPQMSNVATEYDHLLEQALSVVAKSTLDWRQPRTTWVSSVTGEEIHGDLVPGYWSRNLKNRVLFNSAVAVVGRIQNIDGQRCFLEIGPHSALSGPLKQIFKANKFDNAVYIPTLLRNSNSDDALLNTAGSLFLQNYGVDLEAVNAAENFLPGLSPQNTKINLSPLILVDLPPYQWNYEKRYWAEPRTSQEQRRNKYPRHDILGTRIVGVSDGCLLWRNKLRHKDVPWMKDHKLGKVAVFPAAGHLSLAIEALRQVSESNGIQIQGVKFKDISIKTALIIPEHEDGIEIQFSLKSTKGVSSSCIWHSFAVESITDGVWTTNCEGFVRASLHASNTGETSSQDPVVVSRLSHNVPSKRWYTAFDKVGFEYGPSFQRLGLIKSDGKRNEAAAEVEIVTDSGIMQGESRYILHPSTVDACLHLMIIAINAGLHNEMACGVVPVNIEQMSIFFAPGGRTLGNAVAWMDPHNPRSRYYNAHTKLFTNTGDLVMEIQSLRAIKYPAALPQREKVAKLKAPYMQTCWKPDYTTLKNPSFMPSSCAEILELLQHKDTLNKVLFVGGSAKTLEPQLSRLSPMTHITICDPSAQKIEEMQAAFGSNSRITTRVMEFDSLNFDSNDAEKFQDAVILDMNTFPEVSTELLKSIKIMLGDSGKFVLQTRQEDKFVKTKVAAVGFSAPKLQFDLRQNTISLYGPAIYLNGTIPTTEIITLLTVDTSSSLDLASSLRNDYQTVEVMDINAFTNTDLNHQKIVIHDIGGMLTSLTAKSFASLKGVLLADASIIWVTSGVNEGTNVDGWMAQGFLRAIRSEHASAKIALLDVDTASSREDVSHAIMSKLEHVATKDSGADTEYWLHDGTLLINRIMPNVLLNEKFQHNSPPVHASSLPAGTPLQALLVDDEISFFQDDSLNNDLLANEIEFQVLSAEYVHLSDQRPRLVAGRILREGSAVSPSILDQQIITYATDSFSTVLRAPVSAVLPVSRSTAMDLLPSLPKIAQVWNTLVTVGKVQTGDHVLLLPTALDMIAVVSVLAQLLRFKLTVIIDGENNQGDLATQGILADTFLSASEPKQIEALMLSSAESRPNLVVSHDFLALSQDIWRNMSSMGRFVLGESRIDIAPDVLPFTRGASFLTASIKNLLKKDSATLGIVLKSSAEVLAEFEDRLLKKGLPIPVSALNNMEDLEKAKSDTNAVITYDYDTSTPQTRSISTELRLAPDATYILVGCLGGLGRSLTTWMMERGAKSFAFISRSGADKPEAARVVASIRDAGLDAQVYRADISNEEDVAKVLKTITRPIRGVVHAAMVLQDTMFERMTYDRFMAAVIPKVNGARNLHTALQDTPLDFFVMTSSISATLGNPGQANYCAANSYLDGLAWHRNSIGLPAVSLILPMVLDIGVVAENENIESSLTRQAMYGIEEREMLRGFEIAMMQPKPTGDGPKPSIGNSQIILGLEPSCLASAVTAETADAYWLRDSRFRNICHAVNDIVEGDQAAGHSATSFAAQLKATLADGSGAAIQAIAKHVMQRCSRILMVPIEDFSEDGASIGSYGLDSMIGAELRNWLFREFSLEISMQHLLAPTLTFKKLAFTIAESLGVDVSESS